MIKAVGLSVALLALVGCGGEEGNGGGAGGTGVAGTVAGTTAGTSAGAGAGAGTGGAGTGGGAGAGAGAAGMAAAMGVPGCSAADTSVMGPAAHAAALTVLTAESPCGFSSCHRPPTGKADLVLMSSTNLRTSLVGVPSCQVPAIPLVADGGGETALNNSWLWIKLVAPSDDVGIIASNAAWGTAVACGQMGNQPFGLRMPWSNSDTLLETDRMAAVRNWICAGAPGP